jgi:hypothetical protein
MPWWHGQQVLSTTASDCLLSDVLLVNSSETQLHDTVQPGGSSYTTTMRPTVALPRTSNATAALETTTSADHSMSGCSLNCTMNYIWFKQQRNSWTKCRSIVTIGRVNYLVNAANNMTSTSTSYATQVTFTSYGSKVTSDVRDILANGSHVIARTDVNAAGTVTYVDHGHVM